MSFCFKGSFGKCEFIRTTTHTSPSVPLETIPNDKKRYEKPYRLRSLELDEMNSQENNQISDFEKDFLDELNEKMFATSLNQVREQNHRECQRFLQQTSIDSQFLLPETNIEVSSSKLIIFERVHLLPEEVRLTLDIFFILLFILDHLSSTCTRLFNC
jgi:hypothetical protein